MRITDNMVLNSITTELQQLDSQQSSLQSEVSDGLTVSQPSDDPAAFGQVVELEGQSRQLSQYQDNANSALSIIQSSYSSLSSLNQVYERATELGTLATNGSVSSSDLQGYASELNELIDQAVSEANSQFGGQYLFGGSAVTSAPFTTSTDTDGNVASVSYAGNSTPISIPLSGTSSVSPYTSGTTNSGIATMINNMISLRDAIQNGDSDAVSSANTSLASSDDVLTNAVAENGAVESRIEADQTELQSTSDEISNQITSDTSSDLPTAIVQLNQTQIAYQAALETASKVMQLSLVDFLT